jgi:putative ABC transport system permease protein
MAGDPTGGFLPVFHLGTTDLVLGAILAVLVGLAAGAIPAMDAMRLKIVDALRRV